MADWRKLHPHAGQSAKVSALNDFEYRVWTQYLISANDLGVMPAVAANLQAGNAVLQNRPARKVQQALEAVIAIGLVCVFLHQEKRYVFQPDWQDWQSIDWPRKTIYPFPPRQQSSPKTQGLLDKYTKQHGENSASSRLVLEENSKELPVPSHARNPNPNPNPNPDPKPNPAEVLDLPEESPRETTALAHGNPHHKPTNLVNGAEMREHGQHAWCSWPERDGLCVPWKLHREFIGKLGGTRTEAELREWYPRAVTLFANRAVGEDVFVFWRNCFGNWVGPATSKPSTTATKGARAVKAFDDALEAIESRGHS